MKYLLATLVLICALPTMGSAQQPWQRINLPQSREVASQFQNPPPEYGPTVTWGWDGPITREVIQRDLDQIHAIGFPSVTIEAGYRMKAAYLSPDWFRLIRVAAEEAGKRNMRVWIIDEGKYPTGFANGKFSQERPDLRMQVLVADDPIHVDPGQHISQTLPSDAVSAVAYNSGDSGLKILDTRSEHLDWTAPTDRGAWNILVVRHQFRTSPTRAVNNPTRAKDTANSLMDYLNPAATRQFMAWTHDQYKQYMGSEFGKVILGFRSDEPAYYRMPWTPTLPASFQRRKGYDVRPYIAAFFTPNMPKEIRRIKADYWDVWTDLYQENFFRLIARWCDRNNLEYIDHLDKDGPETNKGMLDLVRVEGDFFRDMRDLQIPGVDAIWNQVWPGTVANFPKLASSAAHLFGRPRSFSESFAAYNPPPTVDQARWAVNYQLARGINLFEFMFYSSSAGGHGGAHGYMASDQFPALAAYTNRASFLLSQGRPGAQIAVYFPTSSLWLRDTTANTGTWQVAQQLIEHQRDFDFVDDRTLATNLTLHNGILTNHSGQSYQAVILVSPKVISRKALDQLEAYAKSGGKVLFLGQTPSLAKERTFRDASNPPALDWADHDPAAEVSPRVLNLLPEPAVRLDTPAPHLQVVHRQWDGAELYFFFNESDAQVTRKVTLSGPGHVESWDAQTGNITDIPGVTARAGKVQLSLTLEPHQARFLVLTTTAR